MYCVLCTVYYVLRTMNTTGVQRVRPPFPALAATSCIVHMRSLLGCLETGLAQDTLNYLNLHRTIKQLKLV